MKKYIYALIIVGIMVTIFARQFYRAGYQVGFASGMEDVRERDALILNIGNELADVNECLGRLMETMTMTGHASWYEYGTMTASMTPYDPDGLSAASRWLPFGSRWKITNLANGRSVVAVCNDRGPYVGDRIIDLSRGAAREIGMIEVGITRVKIEPAH